MVTARVNSSTSRGEPCVRAPPTTQGCNDDGRTRHSRIGLGAESMDRLHTAYWARATDIDLQDGRNRRSGGLTS
jgi:hypothetical protein